MPEKRQRGFSSAAGLIQYYDMEETRALKVNPYIVMGMGLAAAIFVSVLSYRIT